MAENEILPAGHQIGSYVISGLLGSGGMGDVYDAQHIQIGRRVAIKVLKAHYAYQGQFLQRFFNEARAVNIVEHPGIVEIFDFGQLPDRSCYLVMELLRGESLRQRIRTRVRCSLLESVRIGRQVASALAAAHEKNIIHRDLKPDNVMLVPDREQPETERAKVFDFGIAKVALQGDLVRTQTHALMGTPLYMSPEQCRGASEVTASTDVYALGVMLFEMLAGVTPFQGLGSGEIIIQHMTVPAPALAEHRPDAPPALNSLLARMLAKDPGARPAMRDVAHDLRQMDSLVAENAAPLLSAFGASAVKAEGAVASVPSTLGLALGQAGPVAQRPAWPLVVGAILLVCASTGAVWQRSPRGGAPAAMSAKLAPAEVAHVRWQLESAPAGATILDGETGAVLGVTPWQQDLVSRSGVQQLLLRLAGYEDLQFLAARQQSWRHRVTLKAVPPPVATEGGAVNPKSAPPPAKPKSVAPRADRPSGKGRKVQPAEKSMENKDVPEF